MERVCCSWSARCNCLYALHIYDNREVDASCSKEAMLHSHWNAERGKGKGVGREERGAGCGQEVSWSSLEGRGGSLCNNVSVFFCINLKTHFQE
jgi:hypothetical protein